MSATPPADAVLPGSLDTARLDELRNEMDADMLDMVMAMMVKEAMSRPGIIRNLVVQGDLDTAKRQAHALRGAALNVGACRLAAAAEQIERAPDGPAMEHRLDALAEAADALIDTLRPDFGTGAR